MTHYLGDEEPPPIKSKYMWRDEETRHGYDTWEEVAVIVATRVLAKWIPGEVPDRQQIARDMAVRLYLNREPSAIEAFGRLTAIVESEPERGSDGQILPVMPRIISPQPVIGTTRKGWRVFSR